MPRNTRLAFALIAVLATITFPRSAEADRITVFAAASLKEALEEVAEGFADESGHSVALSLAGSSVLARQISHGAPADVFISANPEWMDVLEGDGAIVSESRHDLLGNALVLISPGQTQQTVEITSKTDIGSLLRDGRLAMALVDAVPAGIYGKAALQYLGLWDAVADQVVQVDNVRAALALVALGEAELGVVYASDAIAAQDVGVVATFPAKTHPPVVYPVARVSGEKGEACDQFLSYLRGPAARSVFERWGFTVLDD